MAHAAPTVRNWDPAAVNLKRGSRAPVIRGDLERLRKSLSDKRHLVAAHQRIQERRKRWPRPGHPPGPPPLVANLQAATVRRKRGPPMNADEPEAENKHFIGVNLRYAFIGGYLRISPGATGRGRADAQETQVNSQSRQFEHRFLLNLLAKASYVSSDTLKHRRKSMHFPNHRWDVHKILLKLP
jgi:hypothetical protein